MKARCKDGRRADGRRCWACVMEAMAARQFTAARRVDGRWVKARGWTAAEAVARVREVTA